MKLNVSLSLSLLVTGVVLSWMLFSAGTPAPESALADPSPAASDAGPSFDLEKLARARSAFERDSARAVGAEEGDGEKTRAILARVEAALRDQERGAIQGIVQEWLDTVADPAACALELFDGLEDVRERAEAASLLARTALQFADSIVGEHGRWSRASLASEMLARIDLSAGAPRVCLLALRGFGAEIPVQELVRLIEVSQAQGLVHADLNAQALRVQLVAELAQEMTPDVEPLLGELLARTGASPEVRSLAADALLRRDWRTHAPEIVELLRESRSAPEQNQAAWSNHLLMRLGGITLELHGRERLELLREVVADEQVTRAALASLSREQAQELAAFATGEDRTWDGYRWVELAIGDEGSMNAGLGLLADLERQGDEQSASFVLASLLGSHLGETELAAQLDRRFERRSDSSDPYWGALLFHATSLSEEAVIGEILPRLNATRGEESPSRKRLVAALAQRFPELGLGQI